MEEDYSPPSSPAPSGDGNTSVLSLTTQRERHQQRINRPAEKTNNAVQSGKRIPVAPEDCKVRLNARSIFGYGKSSVGDDRKQSHAGTECRRDFEPDTPNDTKTNYGTPTRPKTDTYYGLHDGPFKSDDYGTPKISYKLFDSGTPKGQNKAVDSEVQYIGQKKAVQNGTSFKISDCKNVDEDDDVCIVGWTWNTQAKRKLNADNLRAEADQNGPEHRLAVTHKDGERHHQNAKETYGADKASKNSTFVQKSTSSVHSSVNQTTLHPLKLCSYNPVTSVANNPAPAKQINPSISSPKPLTTIHPIASSTPFNVVTSNFLMTKSLPNNPISTNAFAPKSNVPNVLTFCAVGGKSPIAPSQGKTVANSAFSHHHPVTNSFATTTHPHSVNQQCTKTGDSASAASIPEQPEAAAAGRAHEAVELPVAEKPRRGRTKKPVLVQPNFEVVKRKRGRPRKEPIVVDEPARKRLALEDDHGKVSAPQNTVVSGPFSAETVSSTEKFTLLQDAPKTSLPNASTTTMTSSSGAIKSLDRTGPASADQVRGGGGQSEKEQSWVFELDDEPVLKEESNHSVSDSEVDFQAFSSGIDFRSSLTSTPIKECSVKAEDTKPPKKSKLRIRFKPFVEQFSYDDDADVVLSADALANINRHTSMNAKKVPMVDRLLAQKEREADDRIESVGQSAADHVSKSLHRPNERSATRETAAAPSDTRSTQANREIVARTEPVAAGGAKSSTRPEAHGVKMSLKPLKDSSDVVSGSMAASNTVRQSTQPPTYTKSIPIANARHPTPAQTYEAVSSSTAGKTIETSQTAKLAGQSEAISVSTGPRRKCAGEVSNSHLPPGRIPPLAATDAIPDFAKTQARSNEGKTKSSTDQTTKSVENSEYRKPEEKLTAPRIAQSHQRQTAASGNQNSAVEIARTQQCKTIARPKTRLNVPHVSQNSAARPRDPVGLLPVATVARDEYKHRPRVQKELSFGRKRKMEDFNTDDDDKENQPKRPKTLIHEIAPTENRATSVAADSDKMAPQKNGQAASGDAKTVVVPNGEHVAALLDLQRKLMSISDMSVLRQVVQLIEETGKYRLNEATFDFDLCNLDPLTVKKLQHCLSKIC